MENTKKLSNGKLTLLSLMSALICGMLWRMRGSHGWGSESGLFNVAFVMLLFLVVALGANKKTTPLKIAFTSFAFIFTVPQWGTLNHQILGVIENQDDEVITGVPLYSALIIMLLLGYTIAGLFGIFLGNMYSKKKWKISNYIIIIAVFFAVQYICKATIAHPIIKLIQPISGEAFNKALTEQGITDGLWKTYLAHFDNVSWAKKILGGRNYFAEIELISRFIAVVACQLVTKFAFKDKTAARISTYISIGFALAITVSDYFFLVGEKYDAYISSWSCWEYFTGFFAGLFMLMVVHNMRDDDIEAENNFGFIPEKIGNILVYVIGICVPVAYNIIRPVVLRYDESKLQIPVAILVSVLTVGVLAFIFFKKKIDISNINIERVAVFAFLGIAVVQVLVYFICGNPDGEIHSLSQLHNIMVIISAVVAFAYVGKKVKA